MSYGFSLKKLGLFSLMVVLCLSSCKKPSESLGESLQPDEDILYAMQTDSTSISASVMKKERTRIDIFANILTGNYVDNDFGVVRCDAVFQLSPSNTIDPPLAKNEYSTVDLVIDSVVLSLVYQPEAYGNNVPMYFEVNELTDPLFIDSLYYSDFIVHKDLENLIEPGQETQTPFPEGASLSSSDPKAYLNFKLKNTLGRRLLYDYPLEDFSEFRNQFHGLVLSSQTIDARVISFATAETKLKVYYHNLNDPQTLNGSNGLSYEFVYTSNCESFTKVDQQYYGTALANLTATSEIDGSELCYAQSAGGTRIRVNLTNANWLKQIPAVTINKAELLLPFDKESKFSPLDGLLLTYHKYPDTYHKTVDSVYVGGAVNKTTGLYRFNITRHLQSIINDEISDANVFITDYPIAGSYNSMGVRRSLLHGPLFSPDDPTKNMRLVVTYSY